MKFSVEWIDGGTNAAAEERATLCDLRILLGNDNACRFLDDVANKTFDALTVPAVHLAEGIAKDWWRIFGGRDRRQSLLPYRTGFILPNLQIGFDGTTFEVVGHQQICANPGLRFWQVEGDSMPRTDAETALASFVQAVVDKLAGEGIPNCEVALAWTRVVASRTDAAEAAFCEAAGALGVDPYAISDDDARFIEKAGELFAGEALIEFLAGGCLQANQLAGSQHSPFTRRWSTLAWLRDLESRQRYECNLPGLAELHKQFRPSPTHRPGERPWAQGYRMARTLGKELNLNGSRLQTPEALAKKLGGRDFQRVAGTEVEPGIRAVVAQNGAEPRIHLRDRNRGKFLWATQAETFALARAIGDTLCLPHSGHRVVNNLHNAEQQAVGRAFAAEFLAPVEDVLDMAREGLDSQEIASEFNVSPLVVQHQIDNSERIAEAWHQT